MCTYMLHLLVYNIVCVCVCVLLAVLFRATIPSSIGTTLWVWGNGYIAPAATSATSRLALELVLSSIQARAASHSPAKYQTAGAEQDPFLFGR